MGQPTDPIFQGLEDETDTLSQNVGDYQSTLRKIPEERKSHLRHGGNLQSSIPINSVCVPIIRTGPRAKNVGLTSVLLLYGSI
jgi:hypothetical protein